MLLWRPGIFAALAMALLALYPQLSLWAVRGKDWSGAYAYVDTDEIAYSAYLNALIDGRPRRNDPYTGADDEAGSPHPESLFSIQFVPAYAIALPARVLGLSASATFIVLLPLAAFLSTLAIFWLLAIFLGESREAAAASVAVLCLGTLAAGEGAIRELAGSGSAYGYLPFLRRYIPGVSFPPFFVFCALIWRALAGASMRAVLTNAVAAAVVFALLIFSYFYLWTSAAAWIACLAILYFFGRPAGWKRSLICLGLVGLIGLASLWPYALLLSRRAPAMDRIQALTISHLPDLFRTPELIGLAALALLVLGIWSGIMDWKDRRVLFAASFALTPAIVFNQQVISGRALQPIHYEEFIANYLALGAAALAISLFWHEPAFASARTARSGALVLIATIAFAWGVVETITETRGAVKYNVMRDQAMPVGKRLAALAGHPIGRSRPVVLSTDIRIADSFPTIASASVLWARHLMTFSGNVDENRERFFQQNYYSGIDERQFERLLADGEFNYRLAIFGWERANPSIAVRERPITIKEMGAAAREYGEYIAAFDRRRAAHPTLSFLVVPGEKTLDLSNLDRWYERDGGEVVGSFVLYRLKLRTGNE